MQARKRAFCTKGWQKAIAVVLGLGSFAFVNAPAFGDPGAENTQVAIKAAERALRIHSTRHRGKTAESSAPIYMRSGPNFSGRWAGRYVKVSDNCGLVNVPSFLFRHVLVQSGGVASLATSHDGTFSGGSRDRGRRLEFAKPVTTNCTAAVFYKNLSRNRQVSGTAFGYACTSGCVVSFVANAIRN